MKTAKLSLIGIGVGSLLILAGCKPTEKNYKAAYEIAQGKKDKAKAEEDPEEAGMIRVGQPRTQVVNGEEVGVLNEYLSVDKGVERKSVNVVVAQLKMPTNAKSGAENLCKMGYKAFAAQGQGDRWFVVAGSFDTMQEGLDFIKKFRTRNPEYPYIGLSGAPIIVRMIR